MPDTWDKDPESVLSYQIDWTDWLNGDTISTSSWTVFGVTKDSDSKTSYVTTITISGGTPGQTAKAVNHIVTAAGLEEDRTLTWHIKEL